MLTKSIIVAIDENNAIGKDNNLLCHLPNDLKHFKTTTSGHTVIMGRKTFESLPNGALPNRRNIVLTRNKDLKIDGVEVCISIDEAIELCKEEEEIFFIGGADVYESVLGIVDKLYVTEIHNKFEGADAFFPEIESKDWEETSRIENFPDEKNFYSHSFVMYNKRR